MFSKFYKNHGEHIEDAKKKYQKNIGDKKELITHNDRTIFTNASSFLKERINGFDNLELFFKDIGSDYAKLIVDIFKNIVRKNNYKAHSNSLVVLYEEIISNYYVNTSFYIPYIGGYSDSCKIIYIDKDSTNIFTKKQIMSIVLHEYIEKSLVRNCKELGYVYAHQIAQQIEYSFYSVIEEIAFQERIDSLEEKLLFDFNLKANIPLDLDKTPYVAFNDDFLLSQIKNNIISNMEITYEYIGDSKNKHTLLENVFNIEKAMFERNKYYLSSLEFYKRASNKKNHKLFIATTNTNEVVGVAYFILTKKSVRFYSLAVLKGYQQFDVAKTLFDEIFFIANKYSKTELFLEIRKDNIALMRNYTKKGFNLFKVLPSYYPDGVDGLRLHLSHEPELIAYKSNL